MDNNKTFVTLADVAKHAGVSKMTVSRVLNSYEHVSPEVRERVERTISELGYVPNALAQGLSRGKTNTIALIVPDVRSPFFTEVAYGAEDVAQQNGYVVMLCNSDDSLDKERQYVERILSSRFDGVILTAVSDASRKTLQPLMKRHFPLVLLFREVETITSDIIVSEAVGAAKMLTQHLINVGHRHIAFANAALNISTARYRLQGYKQALEENGIFFDPVLHTESGQRRESGYQSVADLLRHPPNPMPTAIITHSSLSAVGAIEAVRDAGLRVPDDLAIVCFEDLELASAMHPFLTVAAHPARAFGTLAAQFLLERLGDGARWQPRKVLIAPELIVRESCGVNLRRL